MRNRCAARDCVGIEMGDEYPICMLFKDSEHLTE